VAVTVYRQKIKDFGTVRGRLGYAYGQALPYLTGGWAWARNSLNIVEDAGANTTDALRLCLPYALNSTLAR
jgi:opacity protein-like surface antigen